MKKEGKIHILFSAFLVVCACCRNKVLQIETRERERGGRGKARLVSLFHFLCWNPGLEHLKTKKISKLDVLLLFKGTLKAATVRGSWCHSGPWRPRAGARRRLGPELPSDGKLLANALPIPLPPPLAGL